MDHTVPSIASPDQVLFHEQPPLVLEQVDQVAVVEPTRRGGEHPGKFWSRLGLPLLAVTVGACSYIGDHGAGEDTDGKVPTEATDPTQTTETVSDTEPTVTTILGTTTSVATTETTLKADAADAANCRRFIATFPNLSDYTIAPTTPEPIFVGRKCDGLSLWHYGYDGVPSDQFSVKIDLTGAVFDSKDFYNSPPITVGSAAIPPEVWKAKHPAFEDYGAMSLEQIGALIGDQICLHEALGEGPEFEKTMTLENIVIRTHYDPDYMIKPYSYPALLLTYPSGASQYISAPFAGATPYPTYPTADSDVGGTWSINWVGPEC